MPRVGDETFGASTDPQALFLYDSGKRSGHPPSQTRFGNSDSFPQATSSTPDPLVDIQTPVPSLDSLSIPENRLHHGFSRPTQDPTQSVKPSSLYSLTRFLRSKARTTDSRLAFWSSIPLR
jgi:hypothetical protein